MIAEGVIPIDRAADKNRGTAEQPGNTRLFGLRENFN
jgi:hypothetical protein